jgi:AcrR family transcriptional regulator
MRRQEAGGSVKRAAGLDRKAVVVAAAALVDKHGASALTLADLARRLGVRTQSLYSHIAGLDDLQRELALYGVRLLGEDLRTSAIGRSGRDALRAIAYCYRRFATERSGLYLMTVRAPGDDQELRQANFRCAETLTLVLESYGLTGDENVHFYRAFWSAIHGFVLIEATGVMAQPVNIDTSFERMVDVFTDRLETQRAGRSSRRRR